MGDIIHGVHIYGDKMASFYIVFMLCFCVSRRVAVDNFKTIFLLIEKLTLYEKIFSSNVVSLVYPSRSYQLQTRSETMTYQGDLLYQPIYWS